MKIDSFYSDYFLKFNVISTDSRKVVKDSIFISLSGENFNGNRFASSALENGAALAVVDDADFFVDNGKYVLVDDSLTFLQKLANYHRTHFNCPVLAITGTNGKTTTKELVAGALSLKFKTYYTQGNLNNQIGVPLTLLSVNPNDAQFVVVEMGANHLTDIQELCDIAQPDYALVTSVGKAHLEGFGSIDAVVKTKTDLYRFVEKNHGICFVNADSELLMNNKPNSNFILYGTNRNDVYLTCWGMPDSNKVNVSFKWRYGTEAICNVSSSLYGQYNYLNMLAAACVACFFGVDCFDVNDFLSKFNTNNNRSQIIEKENVTIISDAYNANPSSVDAALSSLDKIDAADKVVILGDMFELGADSSKEHESVVNKLKSMNLKKVFLVGENYYLHKQCVIDDNDFMMFKTTEEVASYLKNNKLNNCIVLLKGSRAMKLEQLIEVL